MERLGEPKGSFGTRKEVGELAMLKNVSGCCIALVFEDEEKALMFFVLKESWYVWACG
jgi:hypothetical protein